MTEVRSLANAREARLLLGKEFKSAIRDFEMCNVHLRMLHAMLLEAPVPFNETALRILGFLYPSSVARGALSTFLQEASVSTSSLSLLGPMKLFVRIRPLMPQEIERREYACATSDNRGIVVHDGRIAKDGRSLYVVHRRFLCSTFDAQTETARVYDAAVRPLVTRAVESMEAATVLLWGQTGTGKTYTASGLLRCFAEHVFSQYGQGDSIGSDSEASDDSTNILQVRVFEMAGTKRGMQHQMELYDLLTERKKVFLRCDENEQAHVRGCAAIPCRDIEAFFAALDTAFEHRTSSCVERNENSSRSHMFVEVILPGVHGTVIRIGDLAGSERNYESHYHSRAHHAEGGDINASLMALKDCIRLRRQQLMEINAKKQVRVPYRSSKLTLYLKDCFTSTPCALISTVSPSATDVDHTINTLVHVNTMRSGPGPEGSDKLEAGRRCVFKAKTTTVQSKASKANVQEWNILNRWDNVQADEDIYQLEGADAEALVWITRHRADDCHDVKRWTACQVQKWLSEHDLEDAGIPSSMTGAQLLRLGARRIHALCGERGSDLLAALQHESDLCRQQKAEAQQDTRRIYGLALGTSSESQDPERGRSDAEATAAGVKSDAEHSDTAKSDDLTLPVD
eukprot:CAMPEP_0197658810 /NCGR_PEP_ID=MMETSP1338-20131121/45455_1 /TAXON_ID=43686 ORGANISM="Pelagodinium beii, Strain RCC1491" /NCGR_SAMPLE_ID=MMETSP1338 /ASSEMBLY_ACC=CAM_ASM_000754 /LENGTH=626 /DNA_ID=CAMNT_0043235465 /DNA_START=34 /DNA_END=1914 /DNA_ORIENTATION=+